MNDQVTYRVLRRGDGRRELELALPLETWEHMAAALIGHGDDGCHDLAILLRTQAQGTRRLASHRRPVDGGLVWGCTLTYRIGLQVDGRISIWLALEPESWAHIVDALRGHGDAGCHELAAILEARASGSRRLPVHSVPFAGDYIPGTGAIQH